MISCREPGLSLRRLAWIFLVAAAVAWAAPQAPRADDAATPSLTVPELHDYLRGATRGILLHETAHALIDILDIPAVGPEEDVADEFAAMVTIDSAERSELGHANVRAMVNSNYALWTQFKKSAVVSVGDAKVIDPRHLEIYDSHSPDIRRAYHTLCLLYGAFPLRYEWIPLAVSMDEGSAGHCIRDFGRKKGAWYRLLSPFAPKPAAASDGGGSVSPPPSFLYAYEPSATPKGRFYENLYLGFRDIDTSVIWLLNQAVSLEAPLPMQRRDCGFVNAAYDPSSRSIVFCNELVHLLADGFVSMVTGADYDTWWALELTRRVQSRYVGLWHMTSINGVDGGPVLVPQDLELKADGTFAWVIRWSQREQLPHEDTERRGLWGVVDDKLWLLDTAWVPTLPADCLKTGCEPPNSMDGTEARYVPIVWVDDDTISYNNGIIFRRDKGG